jgi:DNA-binding winged helix-turn-helix (wHTH) protein/TolB-like protein
MQRFRFGIFEFDAAVHELRREGRVVRLQPQPALLLAHLLEHAGEVVSREELRKTVWREDTFVDFERGLNFCIGQLRATLGDDATNPRFIRTVPKRGYQFIAPVEHAGVPETNKRTANQTSTSRRVLFAVAATCVLAAMLFGFLHWFRVRAGTLQSPIVAVLRFDNETGDPEMTRFSDGVTDMVVADLTSKAEGRYRVIGNAKILRLPRDQRDLSAVGAGLGATYVILGQVQRNGVQTRILVHLIHLPEQTHVWVSRMDRQLADPLVAESEIAQKVASDFAGRIRVDYLRAVSHSRASL